MTSYVGTLHFSLRRHNWSTAKSRMEIFFRANVITNLEQQQALFLASLDEDAYMLVSNLCVPLAPETMTYAELVALFDNRFNPSDGLKSGSVFTARCRFYNATRQRGESLHDWAARIRNLGRDCKFKSPEDHILDRFILGLPKGPVKDRLFEEDPDKLDLSKALNIASAKESSAHQFELLKKEVKQASTTRSEGKGLPLKKRSGSPQRTTNTTEPPARVSCGRHHKDQLMSATLVSGGMGMSLPQKMGLKLGEGLVKNHEGSREPLKLPVKMDKKGFVCAEEMSCRQRQQQGKIGPVNLFVKAMECKHPISLLSEFCARRRFKQPEFQIVKEGGPPHIKRFIIKVTVNGVDYQPSFTSSTKKIARSEAAKVCLRSLGILPSS